MDKLIPFPLQKILHRYTRSLRHHARNIVGRHAVVQHRQRGLALLGLAWGVLRQLPLQLGDGGEPQAGGDFELALPLRDFKLVLGFLEALLGVFDFVETGTF